MLGRFGFVALGQRALAGEGLSSLFDEADSLLAENSFEAPDRVAPRTTAFSPAGTKFELTLPANSLTVVRVGVRM